MERTIEAQQTNFWIGTWEGGWRAVPLVALLAGAWSRPPADEQLTALALAATLLLAGWEPLWRAIATTAWATPLAHWRVWEQEAPSRRWPYLQPGTPGAALNHAWGRARAWWQALGAAALSAPLRSAFLALLVSLLLGVVLGRTALFLTLLLLACAQLAALWDEGRGRPGPFWQAITLVGIPWLLGASLAGETLPLLAPLAVTLLAGFLAQAGPTAILGPLLTAGFLVWQGHPFAAGMLLLLAFPGLLLLTQRVEKTAYHKAVALWLIAMLLLVGGTL
ncbi:MAG: hypothetical protein U9R05_09545 [Chloroflexota bacterium]|nr:hypothetical protein [Chloroflexota bacterium]